MPAVELPPAKQLIAAAKEAMEQAGPLPANPAAAVSMRRQAANKVLDQWKPDIDEFTDPAGAAAFLGLAGRDSVRRQQHRKRADGTPGFPAPDNRFGGSRGVPVWKYRTIVIHLAEAPTRGHKGMVRAPYKPRQPKAQPGQDS